MRINETPIENNNGVSVVNGSLRQIRIRLLLFYGSFAAEREREKQITSVGFLHQSKQNRLEQHVNDRKTDTSSRRNRKIIHTYVIPTQEHSNVKKNERERWGQHTSSFSCVIERARERERENNENKMSINGVDEGYRERSVLRLS